MVPSQPPLRSIASNTAALFTIEPIVSPGTVAGDAAMRSEEHTSELQSLMRISYAVFCLKKKKQTQTRSTICESKHAKHNKTNENTQRKIIRSVQAPQKINYN